MNRIFQSYGKYYDIIYADKDYEKECNFLEEIFRKYSKFMPKAILDSGCGTGGHAIPLAKRGYEVTGIDLSETMISIAKEKASKSNVNVDFNVMDLRELRLNKKFDACICMFAVIDYLINSKDLLKALFNIRKHIKDGALLIFDFWYGPAVLTTLPIPRMKIIEKDGIKVIRFAEPHMDTSHHICEVNYYFMVIKENFVVYEGKEKHRVRFYFPEEIKHFLQESGFKLLKFCPFLSLNAEPNEKTWNVTAIAQGVDERLSSASFRL
jgi:SAM-dependent methyltransferase